MRVTQSPAELRHVPEVVWISRLISSFGADRPNVASTVSAFWSSEQKASMRRPNRSIVGRPARPWNSFAGPERSMRTIQRGCIYPVGATTRATQTPSRNPAYPSVAKRSYSRRSILAAEPCRGRRAAL